MTSTISDNTHALLNKLRVVGQIKEGQKLSTNGNNLYIYADGWMNWFFRKWSHDSKDEGVRTLRDLFRSLDQSTDVLILDTKSHNETKHTNALYFIINIAIELKNSIKGLENLAKTYVNYQTTVAEIVGLVKDFALVRYRTLLSVIPSEKMPKELKESVSFRGECVYRGIDDIVVDIDDNNPDEEADSDSDEAEDADE